MNMLLKNKIEKQASNVASQQSGNSVFGIVKRSDPDNNLVDVEYMNMNGSWSNKSNVQVKNYFDDGVGSFPDVGSTVELSESFGSLVVVAYYDKNYSSNSRSKKKLVMDIFSDTQEQTAGGVIF